MALESPGEVHSLAVKEESGQTRRGEVGNRPCDFLSYVCHRVSFCACKPYSKLHTRHYWTVPQSYTDILQTGLRSKLGLQNVTQRLLLDFSSGCLFQLWHNLNPLGDCKRWHFSSCESFETSPEVCMSTFVFCWVLQDDKRVWTFTPLSCGLGQNSALVQEESV